MTPWLAGCSTRGEALPAAAGKDPDFGSTVIQRHPWLGNLAPSQQVCYRMGLRVGVREGPTVCLSPPSLARLPGEAG